MIIQGGSFVKKHILLFMLFIDLFTDQNKKAVASVCIEAMVRSEALWAMTKEQ